MAVSFSASAKAEICRVPVHNHCCALAQTFGILLFANSFSSDGIRIITESREFAYILPKLFKKAFDVDFDSYPSLASSGKLIFTIEEPEKISWILSSFGFSPEETLALHVNLPVEGGGMLPLRLPAGCVPGRRQRYRSCQGLSSGNRHHPRECCPGDGCSDSGSDRIFAQDGSPGRGTGAVCKAE